MTNASPPMMMPAHLRKIRMLLMILSLFMLKGNLLLKNNNRMKKENNQLNRQKIIDKQ